MRYPKERTEAVLKKMLPPDNKTIKELAKEEGISEGTLYNQHKEVSTRSVPYKEWDNAHFGEPRAFNTPKSGCNDSHNGVSTESDPIDRALSSFCFGVQHKL